MCHSKAGSPHTYSRGTAVDVDVSVSMCLKFVPCQCDFETK